MPTQFGMRASLNLPYEQAIEKTVAALLAEGFGVLTQIDVKATLKQKINEDFRRYVILGACNPALAHRALSANLNAGLLMPCNVTVYEEADGSIVTAVDPLETLGSLKEDNVAKDVAMEARAKLQRVVARLT
ncbi:MAG: DUF302 domain-containing protein [bacterium]|jgi:uncharacterized protein (DUF302 family)|nr:DUF302 domain-containing protein [bacterium]